MNKLSASVVGGGSGGQLSMKALENSPYFELVAAADLSPLVCDGLKEKYPGIQVFQSHLEMFQTCPTDVVCVSTYPPSHEEVTMDALKLNLKGILVEKPLGHSAASGRRILEAVQAKKIPIAVPHGLLTKETPIDILNIVHKGQIGELKLVEIECAKWDIMNAGIHWLNFCVQLVQGDPVDFVMALCEGSTRTYRDGMQVETTGITYVQTKNGTRFVMNTGDDVKINDGGDGTQFRIVGTHGKIEFWGWENGYRLQNKQNPEGKFSKLEPLPVAGHQLHLENMYRMIENGYIDDQVAESSLTALEICEAAYLSSKHQCKVTFPFESFQIPVDTTSWDMGVPYMGIGGGRDGRKL